MRVSSEQVLIYTTQGLTFWIVPDSDGRYRLRDDAGFLVLDVSYSEARLLVLAGPSPFGNCAVWFA